MQSLGETEWDVVISGTGLQQSLLALALSRSNKKVLHVDLNEYYGGPEAAFSLQEVEEWAAKLNNGINSVPFSSASVMKSTSDDDANDFEKLSFSRAYTLTLSPQIIYSRSKLLSQLVSSKVYKQLEFQAVGSWWIYNAETNGNMDVSINALAGGLKRIPSGREDVFSDDSIDVRAKRSLMKFLKFVVDYENQSEIWQSSAEEPLTVFLSTAFNLPPPLQTTILALTLSIDLPDETTVRFSLPRIARHLTSMGVFGPGFGAVIPKWGGSSEIAQVACRAGAVGGGVYMLGTGIKVSAGASPISVTLTNDETIQTKAVVQTRDVDHKEADRPRVSKIIAIVSSDLASLFPSTVEGGPTAAVSVINFPSQSLIIDGQVQPQPVYIMVHSSDTGECPAGQCVVYASSSSAGDAKARLNAAISALLNCFPLETFVESTATRMKHKVLYSVYYEQMTGPRCNSRSENIYRLGHSSVDLAFDDTTLDNVEDAWRAVMGLTSGDQSPTEFSGTYMAFEDREPMGEEECYDGA